MKTFDHIADEFFKEMGYSDYPKGIRKVFKEIAKRYAEQALDEAAEKADNVITRNQILSIKQIL